jgi:hypothetical protein
MLNLEQAHLESEVQIERAKGTSKNLKSSASHFKKIKFFVNKL